MQKKTSLTIHQVEDRSPADKAGLKAGDVILTVNGHNVSDEIDFQFYADEDRVRLEIQRDGKQRKAKAKRKEGQWWGLSFEPMDCMACGNNCIFCFVDQNARGMRETLYFKDEDYRHSFLYGNYVTLTILSDDDIERIITQRLSPLYISVHATQPEVRKRLLGIKKDDRLLDKIARLTEGGIELHAQVVLCPGINDGDVLIETCQQLSAYYPVLKSLAVVPVGLTRYRESLPALQSYEKAGCQTVLRQAEILQSDYQKTLGTPFVFFADEFYLRGEEPLPEAEHYEGFWQIENGVGMMRDFLDAFEADRPGFPIRLDTPRRITLVSGQLAGPVLAEKVMPVLEAVDGLTATLVMAENSLYGPTVTVSGLLPGCDYREAARTAGEADLVVLPPNCINHDGLFLDNLSLSDLESELEAPVTLLHSFSELWNLL